MEKNENEFEDIKATEEWKSFCDYYMEYNLFDQLNFFRYEDMHTNMLCSLLDKNNAYKLGTFPLTKLIELLILKNKNKIKIDADDLNKYNIENVSIESQKAIDKNRLDLEIDFSINNKKYSIILENKIYSEEHDKQCEKYYKYFKENGDDDTNYIFVYLSLEKKPKFSCKEKYINITYHELVTEVIEPCSDKCTNSNPKIISLYLYLSSFSKLYEYIFDYYDIPLTLRGKEVTIDLYVKYNDRLLKHLEYKDDFYNENKNVLDIYYYNIHKLITNVDKKTKNINEEVKKMLKNDVYTKKIINNKLLKIRCIYKNGDNEEKVTYKDCYLKIVKYLFKEKKVIKTQEDLDKLNDCELNKNYVVATTDFEGLCHPEFYKKPSDIVGKLKLYSSDEMLYYYVGPIRKEELEHLIKELANKFDTDLKNMVEIN